MWKKTKRIGNKSPLYQVFIIILCSFLWQWKVLIYNSVKTNHGYAPPPLPPSILTCVSWLRLLRWYWMLGILGGVKMKIETHIKKKSWGGGGQIRSPWKRIGLSTMKVNKVPLEKNPITEQTGVVQLDCMELQRLIGVRKWENLQTKSHIKQNPLSYHDLNITYLIMTKSLLTSAFPTEPPLECWLNLTSSPSCRYIVNVVPGCLRTTNIVDITWNQPKSTDT